MSDAPDPKDTTKADVDADGVAVDVDTPGSEDLADAHDGVAATIGSEVEHHPEPATSESDDRPGSRWRTWLGFESKPMAEADANAESGAAEGDEMTALDDPDAPAGGAPTEETGWAARWRTWLGLEPAGVADADVAATGLTSSGDAEDEDADETDGPDGAAGATATDGPDDADGPTRTDGPDEADGTAGATETDGPDEAATVVDTPAVAAVDDAEDPTHVALSPAVPTVVSTPDGPVSPRVTDIGAPEEIDRLDHPIAVGVGLVVLVLLMALAVVAFGRSLGSGDAGGEVARVVVPRMAGRSLVEAQTALERQGLIVDVTYDSNEVIPADIVIDQDPIAGARLEVGEQVLLRVSDGPAGIDVPTLAGLQGGEAVKLLQTVGLVAATDSVFDETIRPGEVVNSTPVAGARAVPGATVTVHVSQGPAPRTVPEVVGKPVGEAVVALARADLTVGDIVKQYSPDQVPGTVLASDPAVGAQAPRDQPVKLTIASPDQPIEAPDVVGLTKASATTVAQKEGLVVSVRNQEVPAGDTRIGIVISQTPIAGSKVASGATMQLTVGILAVPTTTTTAPGATTTVAGAPPTTAAG